MKILRRTQGFALITVIMFTTFLALMAAVLLRYSVSELRLNQRNTLRLQGKNAAEAMLEYGSAELMARLQRNLNFSTRELRAAPLTTQNTRKSILFATGASTYNQVDPTSLAFYASQYSEAGRRFVDPGDPGNDFDPLRGQNVRSQTIRLLAKATASAANGPSQTSYATETIEIRDCFLFNYAIYYSIPMEFHPGPNMTVSGPVHSNVASFITANATLTFQNTVTTASTFTAGAAATGRPTGLDVRFATGLDLDHDGVPDTIAVNSSSITGANGHALGTYVDSNLASRSASNSFAQVASQVWRGNLQDSSMGIIPQNLPAISSTTPQQAHDLIEPPDATVTSASAADVQSREAQKYSKKAGLYIVQGVPVSGSAPSPVAFYSPDDAQAYKAQSTAALRATWLASNPTKVVTLPTGAITNQRRMFDYRENAWVNTVDLNLGVIRTAVLVTPSTAATTPAAQKFQVNGADWNLDGTSGWNGQVYVDVENPNTGFTSTSDITAVGTGAGTRTSVRLVNGGQLPNRRDVPAATAGYAFMPDGFTVATNAPVYIVGNYNSPGVQATDTAANIGTPKTGEAPAAVIGDAVNILSSAWWNAGTGKPAGDANSSGGTSVRNANDTEICAAILGGNVPTNSSGTSYSGGVENYPRFHEDWSGNRLRYRGSMVCLFNSEIATGPWSRQSYSPPTREWGFSTMFSSGRQPPGTPMLRTFRRVDYRDISKTDFDALLANTTYGFTAM